MQVTINSKHDLTRSAIKVIVYLVMEENTIELFQLFIFCLISPRVCFDYKVNSSIVYKGMPINKDNE